MRQVGCHRVMRESRETDFPAAISHMNGLIDSGFSAGAFDHVIRAEEQLRRSVVHEREGNVVAGCG